MSPPLYPRPDLPLRILFLAANPSSSERLRIDKEFKEIQKKVRDFSRDPVADINLRFAVDPDDLQQTLLEVRPHVVHFSGHGARTEGVIVEHPSNNLELLIGKGPLINLFKILRRHSPVRLAIFNACHSKPIAEALVEHVDCAIGMNAAIADDAAIKFAAAFYQAIAFGCTIQEAFELGRNMLELLDLEASGPELFPRNQPQRAGIVLVAFKPGQGTGSGLPKETKPANRAPQGGLKISLRFRKLKFLLSVSLGVFGLGALGWYLHLSRPSVLKAHDIADQVTKLVHSFDGGQIELTPDPGSVKNDPMCDGGECTECKQGGSACTDGFQCCGLLDCIHGICTRVMAKTASPTVAFEIPPAPPDPYYNCSKKGEGCGLIKKCCRPLKCNNEMRCDEVDKFDLK